METFTSSQQAALDAPAAEVWPLVEIDGLLGTERLSTQPLYWNGERYAGRLDGPPQLSIGGGGGTGVSRVGGVTIRIHDADARFASLPVETFRRRPLRVLDVLPEDLGTGSVPLRTLGFIVTQQGGDGDTWVMTAQDPLSVAAGTLVPPVLVDETRWPSLPAGAAIRGRPIPALYGRAMTELFIVDQTSATIYLAAAGANSLSGNVVELWNGGFSPLTYVVSGVQFPPYSTQVVVRGGVTVTELVLHPDVPTLDGAGNVVRRFADFTGPEGPNITPAQLVGILAGDPLRGVGGQFLVDSPSLVAAHSAAVGAGLYVDATLTQQVRLIDALDRLSHDGLLAIDVGATTTVTMQGSRVPVGSFHPGNIVEGTFRQDDLPIDTERSRRVIRYRDRVTDADPVSIRERTVGSGAAAVVDAWWIGRPSVADLTARTWAAYEAAGVRRVRFDSTFRTTAIEVGDRVTLTHSRYGYAGATMEVAAVGRAVPLISFELRPLPDDVFAQPAARVAADDPTFEQRFQRVLYQQGSKFLAAGQNLTVVASHQLARVPTRSRLVATVPDVVVSSMRADLGTGSAATMVLTAKVAVNVGAITVGWDLFT